jgi:hypothetical protein
MKLSLRSVLLVGTVVAAAAAHGQSPLDIGASAGVYIPSDGAVRNAFGSSIFRFGFGQVGRQSTGNFKIGTELDFITANKNGNRLFIVPFTLTAEQQLGFSGTTRPYIKPFAGLAYMDYSVGIPGGRSESKVVRFTYGLEGGVVVSDHLRLSARYNVFPKTGGLDFSGLTLMATFSLR